MPLRSPLRASYVDTGGIGKLQRFLGFREGLSHPPPSSAASSLRPCSQAASPAPLPQSPGGVLAEATHRGHLRTSPQRWFPCHPASSILPGQPVQPRTVPLGCPTRAQERQQLWKLNQCGHAKQPLELLYQQALGFRLRNCI